ncbi:hypothetical protein K490DRAFT_68963 [Saccharata proteae CBS 121410]|uniref:RING-type domain-containing protein n=1 Tax=Saccharata proteae CBS 121410 TaxID=1314787 RepID=A0A9P4LUI1_9PEZI|nr:hypothetical protein K490DRAFT_68963 [Saccharata proteae CBS 121410]
MDSHSHPLSSPARGTRHKTPNETSSVASTAASSTARRPTDTTPKKPAASSTMRGAKGPPAPRHPEKLTAESNRAARSSSKDSLASNKSKDSAASLQSDKNEKALKALRTDLESLRSHVTCKICDRLLYEPYVISCGHTYCYTCLCTWFTSNRARKTCPDCRALVVQAPAPAYLVREMALIFISRAELLPSGDTLEQHARWREDEAEAVQQDKNSQDPIRGGLFKGCFRAHPERPALHVLRDEEDGVDRCPLCAYEIEDDECAQCGIRFDEDGALWPNSFAGFSDMDDGSEQDLDFESEDADREHVFEDYDDGMEDWQDEFDDDPPYAVRRWLANEVIGRPNAPYPQGPRRRAAHSAAGGRQRSYSASLVSDMLSEDTEMGVVEEEEEEEEEDVEDGDSSMNDFIVDEDSEMASQRAQSSSSQNSTPRHQLQTQRRRRVVSESSSDASRDLDAVDLDNEDDEGPIAPGRRRPQTRPSVHGRINGRAQTASSVSTDNASESPSLDEEDTQALLHYQAGWSPLSHEDPDEEMDEDEDGDDSDGARTTVGWEPTANSNERYRIGGSLTPTADRPNAAIRPPSRTASYRFPDGSRGLRRRSSVLSGVSSTNYEDGEADDDDSDIDRDGDLRMGLPALRPRGSRLQLRQAGVVVNRRTQNQTFPAVPPPDPDTDDNSDNSSTAPRLRSRVRSQRQEYDPRISWAFAQHMADIRDLERPETLMDHLEQLRAATPVARPRTANRNRSLSSSNTPLSPLSNGSVPPFSPLESIASRHRNPPFDNSSASGMSNGMSPRSERSRNSISQVSAAGSIANGAVGSVRRQPAAAVSSSTLPPHTQSVQNQEYLAMSRNIAAPTADAIDRPSSRVSSRPPSAAGRRGSAGPHQPYPSGPISPGLNFAARFQAQQFSPPFNNNRNPFISYIPANQGPRPRQSVQRLREQSSTATLRPRNSQRGLRQQPSSANVRDGTAPVQLVRQQNSRVNLRPQPSHNRLSAQASTRTLRGNPATHQPSLPVASGNPRDNARSRLTEEERLSRARELISSRQQALGTTNPFASGRSRQATPASAGTDVSGNSGGQYPSGGGQSLSGGSSASSSQASPQQARTSNPVPTSLNRRRSNRNMGTLPNSSVPAPPAASGSGRLRSGAAPTLDSHNRPSALRAVDTAARPGQQQR